MKNLKSKRGSAIIELLIAVVILGFGLPILVRSMIQIPNAAARLQTQNRAESWRTFTDGMTARGVDPFASGLVAEFTDADAASRLGSGLARSTETVRPGAARVTFLGRSYADGSTAEARALGLGAELGAGSAVPPRVDPLPPLPPLFLQPPTVSPATGTFIPVTSLTPSGGAAPATTAVRANGFAAADRVHLQLSAPRSNHVSDVRTVAETVSATELTQQVSGKAWSEYDGSGDATAMSLGDGRFRWVVKVGARLQSYEPSAFVPFTYGISLGRPVYQVASSVNVSGANVGIDFPTAVKIDSGTVPAQIGYPSSITSYFGSDWGAINPSYSWSVDWFSGDSSGGDTRSIFSAVRRPLWTDSQTLTATPRFLAPGVSAATATWTITKVGTKLGNVEYSTGGYDGSTDLISSIDVVAPLLAELGIRVGRPRSGALESTGTDLTLSLIP